MEPIYARDDVHRLVDLNVALIRAVADRLGITTRLVLASELDVTGSSTRLMVSLTRAVGGDVYLSGPTGREYLEPELFDAAGLELRYHEFAPFEYPQLHGEFAAGAQLPRLHRQLRLHALEGRAGRVGGGLTP